MIRDLVDIAKHTSIYSLGTVLRKVAGFVMIPIYTRYLTTADYGVLEIVTLVSFVVSMILSLRLSGAMIRFYYEFKAIDDRNSLVSTSQITVCLVALAASFLFCRQSDLVSQIAVGGRQYSRFFMLIFISMGFELSSEVPYTYLRILSKSAHFVAVSFLQLVLSLGLNIYFIMDLKLGVLGVLYSMIISNGLVCVLLLIYVFSGVGFHLDFSKLKKPLAFGLPYIPASLLIFVLNMGDRFLLNRLGNLSEVGLYALGYKFGMLLSTFVGGPFSLMWAPKRIDIYKNRSDRDEIYSRVFTYLVLVLVLGALGISLVVKDVLAVVADPSFWPAYRVVPLIILGYLFYNLYYFVDIGFYVNNKTYWYIVVNSVAALFNVCMNLLLIPRFGMMGAALVTALSFLICPLLAFIISERYYHVPYDYRRLLKLTATASFIYMFGQYVSVEKVVVDIVIKFFIVLSFPALLYVVGFFDEKELWHIRKQFVRRLRFAGAK